MAMFKSDSQGFLVGELIKTNDNILTSQQQGVQMLTRIRADVSSIARALSAQGKTQARSTRTSTGGQRLAPMSVAAPVGRSRTAGGNQTSGPQSRAAVGGTRRSNAYAAVAVPSSRDARGRFLAGQGKGSKIGFVGQGGSGNVGAAAVAAVGGGLAKLSTGIGSLTRSLVSTDNVDPALNAAKEVSDVVSPLGRGLAGMFGRSAERKKERWYSRILKALAPTKAADKKTGGGGWFGGGGAAGAGAGAGMAQGAAGGIGGAIAGGVGGMLKGGMGKLLKGGKLLKRLPLIGALLSGGAAIGSMMGMNDDASKTDEENRSERYKGAGGAVGMGVGGAIGAVLGSALGPIGTVVGGYLGSMAGEIIGEKAGEWTKTMVDSDIGGQIVAGWNTATTFMGAAWDSVVVDAKAAWESTTIVMGSAWDSFAKDAKTGWDTMTAGIGAAWDKAKSVGNSLNDGIKSATGIDVKSAVGGAASSAWERVKSNTAAVGDMAVSAGSAMVPNTIKRAIAAGSAAAVQGKAGYDETRGNATTAPAPMPGIQTGARAAGAATGGAVNWALGKTSERYESGGKGAGTISTGKGDLGGASYGTYQLASKTGTLSKFLKQSEYGAQFEGLAPGSPEFNAKWKDVAASDSTFGDKQHDFIKRTHYDPMVAGLAKDGIDMSKRGSAAQDAAWSTSVQFGGDAKLIQRAMKGKDANKLTDAEFVSSIQDYKAANNSTLFAKSSDGVRASTLNRATSEKAALLKLDAAQTAGMPVVPSANVPVSVPAQLPDQAKNEVPERLNAGAAAGGKVSVAINDKTTQNVGNRGIAHVVTGGMGAS